MERLTKRNKDVNWEYIKRYEAVSFDNNGNFAGTEPYFIIDSGTHVDKLAEYEDLEEQGLLHIANIPDWSDIYVLYRAESDFDENGIIETKYKYGYTEFLFGGFNKGWFLTKEDAEKALNIN